MRMRITIEGGRLTPGWETLQALISEVTGNRGKLERISRKGPGCDFRAHGTYEVTFIPESGDAVEVVLESK